MKRYIIRLSALLIFLPFFQILEAQQKSDNIRTFNVQGRIIEMIHVDGGTFLMGATTEQEDKAIYDEKPAHEVTLNGFFMAVVPVCQSLYSAVMYENPSLDKGADKPVNYVSWNDCQQFISKLNQMTGRKFRLPTEAEWEYAARGGQKSQGYMFSGSNILGEVAWYDFNSGETLHTSGEKRANELGLKDMSGNVWEWCQDWYAEDYYNDSTFVNPQGPVTGTYRVQRGGSWGASLARCRISTRDYSKPTERFNSVGLRLCMDE